MAISSPTASCHGQVPRGKRSASRCQSTTPNSASIVMPERQTMATKRPVPWSKAIRAEMWLPAKAQPSRAIVKTAVWRGKRAGLVGIERWGKSKKRNTQAVACAGKSRALHCEGMQQSLRR